MFEVGVWWLCCAVQGCLDTVESIDRYGVLGVGKWGLDAFLCMELVGDPTWGVTLRGCRADEVHIVEVNLLGTGIIAILGSIIRRVSIGA